MGLDASVRCNCIGDGKAKPHPFPDMLRFDETGEPYLDSCASLKQWQVHDRWFDESCEHRGYVLRIRLGNIALVTAVRENLLALNRQARGSFPILLEQVLQNGTHSGDHIDTDKSPALLLESEQILSEVSLERLQRRFMEQIKLLCLASIETGNPIVF
jgi:hypothetical protein